MEHRPHSYTCSGCDQEFIGKATITPPGWVWAGSKLFCPDCSNGTAPAPAPAPIDPTSIARIAA